MPGAHPGAWEPSEHPGNDLALRLPLRAAGPPLGLPLASVPSIPILTPTPTPVTGKKCVWGLILKQAINLHPTHTHPFCSEMNFGKRLVPNLIYCG